MSKPFLGIKCALGWCGFKPASDDTGCWGECTTPGCGKRAGFVSRETLRAYCDRELSRRNAETKEGGAS